VKSSKHFLWLPILALISTLPTFAQAPGNAPPERAVVINFILPIQPDTINALISVVNAQIRMGATKITLIVSSPGGDTASAFAAYNVLTRLPVELTTFNTGTIDSAAMLLFCAGKHRYSFPDPARFLIHGNAMVLPANARFDSNELTNEIQQIVNLDKMTLDVVATTANSDKRDAIEGAIHSQIILTPQQAKEWGIIQDIRSNFMEPGAVLVSVAQPSVALPQPSDTQPRIESISSR
jgi:ATP-dependent Clp protease protease subunit